MAARRVKAIETDTGNGYKRLRAVWNIRDDQAERLGIKKGTELEIVDKPDHVQIWKKK